ncbi:hypothetical protein E2C01_015559 [Portunus trituberculatus]|uniref:Uncharacterized protein n=1 Tax=Portunus trituberculatus TaxID=210409 RepID=A0A5B7DLV4_PORTR|nr:hypothetical protein [Portunus trituberculatus]
MTPGDWKVTGVPEDKGQEINVSPYSFSEHAIPWVELWLVLWAGLDPSHVLGPSAPHSPFLEGNRGDLSGGASHLPE